VKPATNIDLPPASASSDGRATPPSRKRPARSPRIRLLPTPQPTKIPSSPTPAATLHPLPSSDHSDPDLPPRLRLLRIALAAALLVLLAALAHHQLFRSEEYAAAAERQSLRRLLEPSPRGRILDREGRVLADTTDRLSAVINLGALRPDLTRAERLGLLQTQFDRLNRLIGRPSSSLDADRLSRHLARSRAFPFPLIETLTSAEATRLTSALTPDDPIRLHHTPTRTYPRGTLAAHLLGRVRNNPIHATAASDSDLHTLATTDLTGDSGLEKQYDALLTGAPAETTVRVNALGYTVAAEPARNPIAQRARTRSENPAPASRHLLDDQPLTPLAIASAKTSATPGRDLTLSLDLDLQRAAETALDAVTGSTRGSAVAIDVRTGEILALVSRPGFDLNTVSPAISAATKQQLDTSGAWLNRATQALYPPGSTFKIFTALAGLRTNTLQPDTAVHCDGFIQIGNRRFPCHNPAGHRTVTLNRALAHSCNIFAARTGLAAGPEALAAEARRFHLAEPTGLDLPAETSRMFVPDPSWKTGDNRGPWTDGDTVNLAIGQGFLRISPLQAACAMASLARRETLTVPTLLRQPGRRPSGDRPPEPLDISDTDHVALLASLRNVVETGIGREAQVPGIKIVGKTGTAQIESPAGMKNVAWFIAFAPVENPQIAVAIALEGDTPGVEYTGAQHAAPIARELLGTYFDKQAKR
jgi:penicillin-binding protein 2